MVRHHADSARQRLAAGSRQLNFDVDRSIKNVFALPLLSVIF